MNYETGAFGVAAVAVATTFFALRHFPPSLNDLEENSPQRRLIAWEARNLFNQSDEQKDDKQ